MTEETVTIDGTEYRVDTDEMTIEETLEVQAEKVLRASGLPIQNWTVIDDSHGDYELAVLVELRSANTTNLQDKDIGVLEEFQDGLRYMGVIGEHDSSHGFADEQWAAEQDNFVLGFYF